MLEVSDWPGTNVVEQDDLVLSLKARSYSAPHILIAAVAMGEHEGFGTIPGDFDVVAENCGHETFRACATGGSA